MGAGVGSRESGVGTGREGGWSSKTKVCLGTLLDPEGGGPAESHREYYVGGGLPGSPACLRCPEFPRRARPRRAARCLRVPTDSSAASASSIGLNSSEPRRRASGRRDPPETSPERWCPATGNGVPLCFFIFSGWWAVPYTLHLLWMYYIYFCFSLVMEWGVPMLRGH